MIAKRVTCLQRKYKIKQYIGSMRVILSHFGIKIIKKAQTDEEI